MRVTVSGGFRLFEGGILAWVHDGGRIYDRNGETRRIHIYDPKLDLAPKSYQPVL